MQAIVTSDQFLAGVISVLALQERRKFELSDTELDRRFSAAFEDLVAREAEFSVSPNFTFNVDPMHGDSSCLRDTLLAAKENKLIALNNPTLHTFDIKLDSTRAEKYLSRGPLPRSFFSDIVQKYFADLD
jgi:hypothetical protein